MDPISLLGGVLALIVLAVSPERRRRSATTGAAATISASRSPQRRPRRLRLPLRARRALPRLELLLSAYGPFALAACWLKTKVPPRVEDKCCVSGVRGAGVIEPRRGPLEYSIDRNGGDYRNIDVAPDAAGAPCKAACDAENKCRAWTYVRPGYIAPTARCYLKDNITRPRHKPCCISGVVR